MPVVIHTRLKSNDDLYVCMQMSTETCMYLVDILLGVAWCLDVIRADPFVADARLHAVAADVDLRASVDARTLRAADCAALTEPAVAHSRRRAQVQR